jgi:hypothetical protein
MLTFVNTNTFSRFGLCSHSSFNVSRAGKSIFLFSPPLQQPGKLFSISLSSLFFLHLPTLQCSWCALLLTRLLFCQLLLLLTKWHQASVHCCKQRALPVVVYCSGDDASSHISRSFSPSFFEVGLWREREREGESERKRERERERERDVLIYAVSLDPLVPTTTRNIRTDYKII